MSARNVLHWPQMAVTLSVLALPLAADWAPGWGFTSHGGFPANPWASWAMNQSTAAYFVGNASGMDNPSELGAEIRLGYVGVGWQLNNKASNFSHLEKYELEEAARLKALRPGVRVGVLRNTEVATVFWDSARARMFDPETQDFWTQCDGKPCAGTWSSPAGNTVKYYFNFSNPRAADWWVREYVGQAVNESAFDGVYFDCSCNKVPGVTDQARFQADAQAAFDRALQLIRDAGKWASDWNSDGSLDQSDCTKQVREWMGIGTQSFRTLQVLGQAFVKRAGASATPQQMVEINNTMAAFLISRGPSAMLELPVLGAYEDMESYVWSPLLDANFGKPLAAASETSMGVFQRNFSRVSVALDCNTYTSTFRFVDAAQA